MKPESGRAGEFAGFPAGAETTPVPNVFFSRLLAEMADPAEVRVALYALFATRRKRTYPRFVTAEELAAEEPLMAALAHGEADPREALTRALRAALRRGVLLELTVRQGEGQRQLLFVNDEAGRRARARLRSGELALAAPVAPPAEAPEPRLPLVQLYEENIGPITPLIAEELREAEAAYPPEWIPRAIRRAVEANVRSWRYVRAILESWQNEGPDDDETAGQDSQGGTPNFQRRYLGGRYGRLLRP